MSRILLFLALAVAVGFTYRDTDQVKDFVTLAELVCKYSVPIMHACMWLAHALIWLVAWILSVCSWKVITLLVTTLVVLCFTVYKVTLFFWKALSTTYATTTRFVTYVFYCFVLVILTVMVA